MSTGQPLCGKFPQLIIPLEKLLNLAFMNQMKSSGWEDNMDTLAASTFNGSYFLKKYPLTGRWLQICILATRVGGFRSQVLLYNRVDAWKNLKSLCIQKSFKM